MKKLFSKFISLFVGLLPIAAESQEQTYIPHWMNKQVMAQLILYKLEHTEEESAEMIPAVNFLQQMWQGDENMSEFLALMIQNPETHSHILKLADTELSETESMKVFNDAFRLTMQYAEQINEVIDKGNALLEEIRAKEQN